MDLDSNGSVCLEEFLEWAFNGSLIGKEMQEVITMTPENYGPPEPPDDQIEEEEDEAASEDEESTGQANQS